VTNDPLLPPDAHGGTVAPTSRLWWRNCPRMG